jgi:hypothetical protein
MKEQEAGAVFEHKGSKYLVKIQYQRCTGCAFNQNGRCTEIESVCSYMYRSDGKSVIFIEQVE